MTFKKDGEIITTWIDYYHALNKVITEGEDVTNPFEMWNSDKINIVHRYTNSY